MKHNNKNHRVVITGIGVVSPIGTGIPEFANALFSGKTGIKSMPEHAKYGFKCLVGAVPDISRSAYSHILKKFNLENTTSLLQYAVLASMEAWTNGHLIIPEHTENKCDYNTGCLIGSGIGPVDIVNNKLIPESTPEHIRKLRSTIVEQSMLNSPSAHLSMILGLGNQVSFNSSACATGTEAIILAAERIAAGKAKRMLAGGTEAYSPHGWIGFDVMRVLNRKSNDNPEKSSAPMSANAKGFVPGAGAGVLLLEDYDAAKKRNAYIYAEITGTHINSGGQRNGGTMTAPSSEAVIKCVQASLKDAEIQAKDIDYINGHLSSTMADVLEIQNLTKALNRYGKDFPLINSLKAQTGHCIGAGGAIESIAGILQLQAQQVAASVNSKPLHPQISELIDKSSVPDKPVAHQIKHLLKTSFGFGDVNACIIFKQPNPDKPESSNLYRRMTVNQKSKIKDLSQPAFR